MKRPLKPGVFGHAQFAVDDGVQVARIRLDRWWDATLDLEDGLPTGDRYRPLVVIGINPSNAGGDEDDNTSAKCTTFARREGANGLVMVNLHPGISTDPDELSSVLLPVGCNELHWAAVEAALSLNAVSAVAGWGKPPLGLATYRDREKLVRDIARLIGRELMCFGTNGDGSPKHPLYLPGNTPLVPWRRA